MKRFRLWRLERCYRRIALLELKAPQFEAGVLRTEFATGTVRQINTAWKARGIKRHERRQALRALGVIGAPPRVKIIAAVPSR